jgi:hypothetical protein
MGELIEGFVSQIEGEGDLLSIAELLTDKETDDWELLVKCFTELNITTIGKDLKRISKFYNLKRWQEISILAIIKMMELMVKEAEAEGIAMGGKKPPMDVKPMDRDYDGSMFG